MQLQQSLSDPFQDLLGDLWPGSGAYGGAFGLHQGSNIRFRPAQQFRSQRGPYLCRKGFQSLRSSIGGSLLPKPPGRVVEFHELGDIDRDEVSDRALRQPPSQAAAIAWNRHDLREYLAQRCQHPLRRPVGNARTVSDLVKRQPFRRTRHGDGEAKEIDKSFIPHALTLPDYFDAHPAGARAYGCTMPHQPWMNNGLSAAGTARHDIAEPGWLGVYSARPGAGRVPASS